MNVRRSIAAGAVSVGLLLSTIVSSSSAAETSLSPIRPEEGQVERLYQAVFDRSPDPAGLAYWFRLRSTSTALDTIAAEFITSPEFANVAGAPTSAEFIDRLYRNVLDRSPDAAGMAYWQQQMDEGLTRVELVVLFSESAEFAAATDTTLAPLPAFRSLVEPVDAAMLGASWRADCPVDPSDLAKVTVSFVDFDGASASGELIVHGSAAGTMVEVFARLYEHRYPIQRMEPVSVFDGDDDASMAANNTSAFNCRRVTGGTTWSRHASGLAIDLNPLQNPYVAGSHVLPPSGAGFVDREVHHPAMIRRGDVVVEAFTDAGWRWGGDFTTLADWQHFER